MLRTLGETCWSQNTKAVCCWALTTAGYGWFAQMLQIVGCAEIKVPMGKGEETKSRELVGSGYPVTLVYPQEEFIATLDG
jgi:hypothetical protein